MGKDKEVKNTETKQEIKFKIEDLNKELKSLVDQYNQSIGERDRAGEMSKRCLGAIETIQKLIGKEEENA